MLGTIATLVLLAAPAATPAQAQDPKALLDCWAKALGGREKLAKVTMVETEGTVATPGEKGTFHDWVRSDGATVQEETFGPVASRSGLDGQKRWVVNGSSPVQDSTGVELAMAVSGAYLDSFSALLPGRMPGEVRAGPSP